MQNVREIKIFENYLFKIIVKLNNEKILFDIESIIRNIKGQYVQDTNGKECIQWEKVNNVLEKNISTQVAKGDFISDIMVYELIFHSYDKNSAKFHYWLVTDIIPAIRRYNAHMTKEREQECNTIARLATALQDEKQKVKRLKKQLEEINR